MLFFRVIAAELNCDTNFVTYATNPENCLVSDPRADCAEMERCKLVCACKPCACLCACKQLCISEI
jgi:hypothetical protein